MSIPLLSLALRNALNAPPNPPAAPDPGTSCRSMPHSLMIILLRFSMPSSRKAMLSGVAPFCGPKTAAAPSGPQNGVSTSHAIVNSASLCIDGASILPILPILPPHKPAICLPSVSKKRNPSASSIPAPASLVALPPMPIKNLLHPFSSASRIISPVPYVDVFSGFRSSGARRGNPDALDISMTAVFLPSISAIPYSASMIRPRGS